MRRELMARNPNFFDERANAALTVITYRASFGQLTRKIGTREIGGIPRGAVPAPSEGP